jgi:hypothetical protein
VEGLPTHCQGGKGNVRLFIKMPGAEIDGEATALWSAVEGGEDIQ